MSDGAAAATKDTDSDTDTRVPRRRHLDFHRALSRIAVSQVCETEGFQGISSAAVDALADVAVRFVKEIGKTSNSYANLSARSNSNVFDVVHALEDVLGPVQGFCGASEVVNRSVLGSGLVREVQDFVRLGDEVPFAFSVPRVPLVRQCRVEGGLHLDCEHIPPWLPAFPRVEEGETSVPEEEKEKGEPAMVNNGGVEEGEREREGEGVKVVGDGEKNNGLEENKDVEVGIGMNPYLVPPVMFGEKEISVIEMPRRTVDGFMLPNHVGGYGGYGGYGAGFGYEDGLKEMREGVEREKDVRVESPAKPPAVRLKLCGVKKKKMSRVNVFGGEDGGGGDDDDDDERVKCNGRGDSEKEEKKRRTEPILMESIENMAVDSSTQM